MPPGARMAIYIRNVLSAIRIGWNVTFDFSIVQPLSGATLLESSSAPVNRAEGMLELSCPGQNFDRYREVNCSRRKACPVTACLKADAYGNGSITRSGVLLYLHRHVERERMAIDLSIKIEAGIMLLHGRGSRRGAGNLNRAILIQGNAQRRGASGALWETVNMPAILNLGR
jgi:hypothetical protein